MSYFPADTYAGIRADPASIVDYFNAMRPVFTAALGMPNVDQAGLEAAFCTVVAYGMASYGPEPGHSLSAILASPTLACDGYVALAWQLLQEFPDGSYASCAAVGWNGGAVGNHCQMLFDDGSTQLLLDPTIGLVDDGVTMAGLTGGEKLGNLTSFYSSADLDAFNQEVIAAVAGGLYKDTDNIFYVTSLTQWITPGAVSLLPSTSTIADPSSSALSLTTDYDWDNRRLYAAYDERDGSQAVYQYDPADNFAWSSVETDIAPNGKTSEIAYTEHDGSQTTYQYDFSDTQSWASAETITSASGQISEIFYREHDGSAVAYQYNLDGYSEIETGFTSAGTVASVVYR